MEISSSLTLEMLGKPFLLEKRIALLYAIKEQGSISKAAKVVPMSYKSAWEAVDMMNSLSEYPLVQKETGGKGGGGTTLTAYGLKLLETYTILKEEHTRFLEKLSEVIDVESGAFKTIKRFSLQLSARNQIQAKIISIVPHHVNAKIKLKLKSGQTLVSVITKEAVENLQLKQSQNVIILFKSSSVKIVTNSKNKSMNNILEGVVLQIDTDQEYAKVVVDIGNENKVVSVLPIELFEILEVDEGCSVKLSIKNNDVMIGR